ncbi:MAG TPA: serine/threonine-protein kinase [Verrucomicrobiae bacterium]|nr:serine/threonine-protein kinase [Verrucomicrobiae bacterium]
MTNRIHAVGDVIASRYKINKFIGEGGMQQVYKAIDSAFARPVVVKVPKNPSATKRFRRSAEVSARVVHPNVAKTLDYFETEETFYLVEEFINGADLQLRLNTEFYYLDPHLAAHIIHHLAKGVAACHHVDVFHRDLKPSNVMVSQDPSMSVLKLTDFGIAKMAEAEIGQAIEGSDLGKGETETITSSQTVVGALPYMAPELLLDSKNTTKSADIWSLGAILFYLLSGEKPFGSGLAVIAKIVQQGLPSKAGVYKRESLQFKPLLDELWHIIEGCLQKDANKRLTADQLVARLSQICYSTAEREVGYIYNYQVNRSPWGFIKTQNSEDYFFHRESFYGDKPDDGIPVNFAGFTGNPRGRAFPVTPLKGK